MTSSSDADSRRRSSAYSAAHMACSTNWLSRHPLKVEVAGSSPAQVTTLATLLYSEEIGKIASLCFVFYKSACKNAKYSCNYC